MQPYVSASRRGAAGSNSSGTASISGSNGFRSQQNQGGIVKDPAIIATGPRMSNKDSSKLVEGTRYVY